MIEKVGVLFVDSRDSFRSVLALSWANHYSKKSGLKGILYFESCGISAINGLPVSNGALKLALESGIEIAKVYTRNLYDVSLQNFDLVIVFEDWHAEKIHELMREEKNATSAVLKMGAFLKLDNLLVPTDLTIKEKVKWLANADIPAEDIGSPLLDAYEDITKKAKIIQSATRNLIYFFVRR